MRQTFTNGKLGLSGRGSTPGKSIGMAHAEEIGVEALVYLSAEEGRLLEFLNLSGMRVEDLRGSAGAPGFLASILGYICGDERLASGFASEKGLTPETLAAARRELAGGIAEP